MQHGYVGKGMIIHHRYRVAQPWRLLFVWYRVYRDLTAILVQVLLFEIAT